uniref:NAD(+) kinase n=2 Tax=Trichobilharzia regenti TaxID=157069 RepID=A0AA85ISB1_TRIRE|nr:unnamed protein product [Trichobilharzia regenti]
MIFRNHKMPNCTSKLSASTEVVTLVNTGGEIIMALFIIYTMTVCTHECRNLVTVFAVNLRKDMSLCRLLVCVSATTCLRNLQRSFSFSPKQSPAFKPRTALILSKLSKYDCEKSTGNHNDDELKKSMKKKGFDDQIVISRHETHHAKLSELQSTLIGRGLEVRVVDRRTYSMDSVNWADVVFTAGGDGTFLFGASKILHPNKPVIGLNTDPLSSHGFLCLPKWCSSNVSTTIDLLLSNHFRWLLRRRIRVTLTHLKGENLQIQPLDKRKPINRDGFEIGTSNYALDVSSCELFPPFCCSEDMTTTVLPVLALNEVFAGESLSACVSVYDISVDGAKSEKQKSSGIVISTGTGSTSWSYQINKIPKPNLMELLKTIQQIVPSLNTSQSEILTSSSDCNVEQLNVTDQHQISNTSDATYLELLAEKAEALYNNSLIFSPEDCKMLYSVRDPITNAIFNVTQPRGFASN